MLLNPTCEAQFRRMLQIGLVTRLYDTHIFPTPGNQKHLYQVTDEKTGKLINLPHPVSKMRVWNAALAAYDTIEPHLDGAPAEADAHTYWEQLLNEFKEKQGEAYILGLLGSPS